MTQYACAEMYGGPGADHVTIAPLSVIFDNATFVGGNGSETQLWPVN